MTLQRFNRLLRDIYGTEGQLAVGKLLAERRKDLADKIQRAATAQGAAADRAEEERFKTTLEARDAISKATAKLIQFDVTEQEEYMEDIRETGKARSQLLDRREPVLQRLRQTLTGPNLDAAEAEYGAFRQWEESLSEQERKKILEQKTLIPGIGEFPGYTRPMTPAEKWNTMTNREQWEALTRLRPGASPALPLIPEEGIPPMPAVKPPARQVAPAPAAKPPATEAPPQAMHFDNRVINYVIFNPVSGMNKQDLGIEPPYLYA